MQVPKETILKLAGLARLNLTSAETENLSADLNRIIKYCSRLKEAKIDTEIPELTPMAAKNVLRDDLVKPSLPFKQAVKNAAETKDSFIVVPRVIE